MSVIQKNVKKKHQICLYQVVLLLQRTRDQPAKHDFEI